MPKSFRRGGIHPPDYKLSGRAAIETLPLPAQVTIPLSQHIGAPAIAAVAKGDKVVVGQVIATAAGFVSSNIHSSVSGTVAAVDSVADAGGVRRPMITIKVEDDIWDESIDRTDTFIDKCDLSAGEIIKKIGESGLVGMGGATFPTQVKLSVPAGKKAEYLLINGVECEPFLTADHRVMLERGQEMMQGIRLLARALEVKKSYIGIEKNKPDAIEHLRQFAGSDIEIVPLKVQYPQGGEKQLIDAVIRREVPSGGLPIDVGAVVQNVGTALAVYEAVCKNKPLFERVLTVTGTAGVNPRNLKVRIGTPIKEILEHCGADPSAVGKLINGGPMMGRAFYNVESPVTKGTSGILLLDEKRAKRKEPEVCIKCAKCVGVCPMGLEPYMLYKLGQRNLFTEMEGYHATDCIECGSCSYTCPAALPLLDYIRLGKGEVMKIVRARKA